MREHGQAAEAAIVAHMRESGTLPAWEVQTWACDRSLEMTLRLDGGVLVTATRINGKWHACCDFPRTETTFPIDHPAEDVAAELVRRLAPLFPLAGAALAKRARD